MSFVRWQEWADTLKDQGYTHVKRRGNDAVAIKNGKKFYITKPYGKHEFKVVLVD